MNFHRHSITFADNRNRPGEVDVQNGLAYTPAEMATMASRGSAINLDVLASDASYDTDNTFRMPFELIRGVDINDAWEMSQHSSARVEAFRDGVNGRRSSETKGGE